MSDELLRRLGRAERENRPAEDWDEVLEGRMTAAEAMARGRARGEDEDELEALARASMPPTESERRAWGGRARAALQATDDDDDDDAPADSPAAEAPVEAPIELATRRARRRWGWGGLATLVAVAAAVLLWLRARPQPGALEVAGEPLPPFTMTVRNGTVGEVRGSADEVGGPARYAVDSRIHWSFQPDEPVAGGLELAAVVRGDDGLTCLTRPEVTRASSDGVLEVRGTVGQALGLGPGLWTVEMIVARRGALPNDGAGCAHPRDLPCPCPPRLQPGASIEDAGLEPEPGAAAWRTVRSYELEVIPR